MNDDIKYLMTQMQLEKTIGELRALLKTKYNPSYGRTDEYKETEFIIGNMISELEDHLG